MGRALLAVNTCKIALLWRDAIRPTNTKHGAFQRPKELSILLLVTIPDSPVSPPVAMDQLSPTVVISLTNATEPLGLCFQERNRG